MSARWVYIICSAENGVVKQIVKIFDEHDLAVQKFRRWNCEFGPSARQVFKEVYCIVVRRGDNLPIKVADHWE